MDSKAKRAAALGYGLTFLLVLPPAHGAISITDAGHALSAYQFDLPPIIAPVVGLGPTICVAAEDRTVYVEADDRTVVVPFEDRTVYVEAKPSCH